MKRALVIACLSTALLLPVTAEAAKMRFGGKSSLKPSIPTTATSGRSRSLVILPGVGATISGASQAAEQQAPRVPFPASTAALSAPALMQLTVNDGTKLWCRSEIVVGGFCVLN